MRITGKAKIATRRRILKAAAKLLKTEGWHSATTRDIAIAAGIANGTLFNYFSTKEAIAAALIGEALKDSGEEESARPGDGSSLEADLFTLIWSGLRNLHEFRKFLSQAMETVFSPLARHAPDSPGDAIRLDHLRRMDAIVTAHGFAGPRSVVTMQLYWTLYLGVLAFWAADESPGQEDTLALLDQSLRVFTPALEMDGRKGNL